MTQVARSLSTTQPPCASHDRLVTVSPVTATSGAEKGASPPAAQASPSCPWQGGATLLFDLHGLVATMPPSRERDQMACCVLECRALWAEMEDAVTGLSNLQRSERIWNGQARAIPIAVISQRKAAFDASYTAFVICVNSVKRHLQRRVGVLEPDLSVKIIGYCGALLTMLAAAIFIALLPAAVVASVGVAIGALLFGASAGVGLIAQGLGLNALLKAARDQGLLEAGIGQLDKLIVASTRCYGEALNLGRASRLPADGKPKPRSPSPGTAHSSPP